MQAGACGEVSDKAMTGGSGWQAWTASAVESGGCGPDTTYELASGRHVSPVVVHVVPGASQGDALVIA